MSKTTLDTLGHERAVLVQDMGRGRALLARAWREAEGPVLVLRFTARRLERIAEIDREMVDVALANPPRRRPLGACR